MVDRSVIVVSGMHRSGTSAMTRVISLLGAALPDELVEASNDNERGFWEGRGVVDLDEKVLASFSSWWGGWQSFDPAKVQRRTRLLGDARQLLREGFTGGDLLVLKDPRVSRVLPLWSRALEDEGLHAVHVVAVRHPAAVAASVHQRNGLGRRAASLSWLAHMLDAELYTRGRPRVFVSFERFMEDWSGEVQRIERSLGITWPRRPDEVTGDVEQFIDPALVHASGDPDPKGALATVGPVHEVLRRWAEDDVRPGDDETLESWRAWLAPVRRAPSAVAQVATQRRRVLTKAEARGQELGRLANRKVWSPIQHEGHNLEADAAWAWLLQERRHARAAEEASATIARLERELAEAGARGTAGRVLRRIGGTGIGRGGG